MLLTIAAGTAVDPDSNPASIQFSAGVDRRGQAKGPISVMNAFIAEKGLTLKISKDPGVSNQWREPQIDNVWVSKRRGAASKWASAFLVVVDWLSSASPGAERADRAQELLEFTCLALVELASHNVLNYPKFQATPRLAMILINEFLGAAPNRPDALEAVVTVAARTLANVMNTNATVVRGDTNSPDAIDVLITSSDNSVRTGIEITDEPITLSKLQNEVQPAMLKHGLDRATVVSRGIASTDEIEIEKWREKCFVKFGQRIDLAIPDDIEIWLSFPAAPGDLSTTFLWDVGPELDALSTDGNRRAWHTTLTDYIESVSAP
jgi:hypothetical protein